MMAREKSFFHAVKWSYITQGSEQGLNTLLTLVFASILGPRDFGILAMAVAYIALIKMFLEQGLVSALIQRKDLKPEHLDSVFCLNLIISVVLMFLSIGLSGWWASLNHLPVLAPVLSVLSISIPIEGLTIVQRAILQRDMDFRSFSIRSIIAILVGGGAGLMMAFSGLGVWALVGKQIVTDLVGLAVLWKLSHWRPRMRLSWGPVKELLGFSSAGLVGNLGLYFNSQSDALLIGFFFGPVAVGLYRLASRICNSVVTAATSSLQAASYPQFCRLQDRPEELRQCLLSCLRITAIITIPALIGMAVTSKTIMSIIGPAWAGASTALVILCVVGIAQSVSYFVGPILQALGKPHYLAVLEWTHALVSAGLLALAAAVLRNKSTSAQVTGIAATRSITVIIFLTPVVFACLRKYVGVRMGSIVRAIGPSLASATVMGCVVVIASKGLITQKVWPAFVCEISVGIAVASGMLFLLDKELRKTVTTFAKQFAANWVAA
jgi:teichuronic acid exporter